MGLTVGSANETKRGILQIITTEQYFYRVLFVSQHCALSCFDLGSIWEGGGGGFGPSNKAFVCFHSDMLEMWQGNGVGVVTWTVNHLKAKDYLMECLDCPIITDCVRRDSVWN